MDKKVFKDFKDIYKLIFIVLTTILLGTYILVKCLGGEIKIFYFNLITYIFIMIVPTIYLIFSLILFKLRSNELRTRDYIREIPYNYSPAMASFMLDENIDALLDIKAVKINLLLNGYLKEEEGFYRVIEKNTETLMKHERYVYESVKANRFVLPSIFQDCLYDDLLKEGYIKEKKSNIFLDILKGIITIIAFVFVCILVDKFIPLIINMNENVRAQFDMYIVIAFIVLLPFVLAVVFRVKSKYVRTNLGKEHAINWKKLKNFINHFTTIKEKEEDYYIILGKYIPYALGLGLAEKIENYIFNDFDEQMEEIKNIYKIQ